MLVRRPVAFLDIVDQILTADEVAKLLRVTAQTALRLAKLGKTPAFKVRSEWRFSRDAIDQFMKSHKPFDDGREQS